MCLNHPQAFVQPGYCWHADDVGVLSMQVPMLNRLDSQHQAPLADLAEWLSQNLQEDLPGDAMVSSPTHPSKWGPLAPAGIVESKALIPNPNHVIDAYSGLLCNYVMHVRHQAVSPTTFPCQACG